MYAGEKKLAKIRKKLRPIMRRDKKNNVYSPEQQALVAQLRIILPYFRRVKP